MDVQVIVFWSRIVAGALAGAGMLFFVWGLARWRPGREKKFCPGALARGLRRFNPFRLIVPRVCGYDLTGVPANSRGHVTCPECGRALRPQGAALRSAHRWRPARVGIACAAFAGIVACSPMLKTRSWQKIVPTTVLIGVKRGVGTEWMPTRLRRELDVRIKGKQLWGWQRHCVIPALQRDLRNDKAERNAYRAREYLREMGEIGRAALERSLQAAEYQERQLAASELRRMCYDHSDYKNPRLVREPSDELLRVTVEGLGSDTMNWSSGTIGNASAGFWFLVEFPERAASHVGKGLASDDAQRRIYCAALVAAGRMRQHYHVAIPILVSHIRDNSVLGDAQSAAASLAAIGKDAEPALIQMRSMGDEQQRAVSRALLARLDPASAGGADLALSRIMSGWSGDALYGHNLPDVRWVGRE